MGILGGILILIALGIILFFSLLGPGQILGIIMAIIFSIAVVIIIHFSVELIHIIIEYPFLLSIIAVCIGVAFFWISTKGSKTKEEQDRQKKRSDILIAVILIMFFVGITMTIATMPSKEQQLIDAASEGDIVMVKKLINKGAYVNARDDILWQTALMEAAGSGHTEIVKILIDAGANVNAKSKYGDTALMEAAGRGYTEIVKALIDAGADVNAKDEHGDTALKVAKEGGHNEVVNLLRAAGARE